MRRLAFLAFALVSTLAAPAPAAAHHWGAGSCGLPAAKPLYVEFAEVSVPRATRLDVLARPRPGLVLATSQGFMHEELRAAGAHTVFWQMKIEQILGLPSVPQNPEEVVVAADRLYARAARETGCATPLIALNELQGARLRTPWRVPNAQYRANTLTLLRRLHAHGARPFLLVPTTPDIHTASPEAADWWRQVAGVGDIVLQVHFNGRYIAAQGPIQASRFRRQKMRRVLEQFEAIGVPSARLGLLHGFQSGLGKGGREGLPLPRWLDVVKWEALAAQQVVAERAAAGKPLATVWSWGWGDFPELSPPDPEKPLVACVYLWARDPALCDAPALARGWVVPFDASREEGRLVVPTGVACVVGPRRILARQVEQLAGVRGANGRALGRETAFGILFRRTAESLVQPVGGGLVDAAEEELLVRRYDGRPVVYAESLRSRGISRTRARQAVADQARRRLVVPRLAPGETFAAWSQQAQQAALRQTTCAGDVMPALGVATLAERLPFLRLNL